MESELKPCPFCGGECAIQRKAPGGTMSSGMEPYMQRVGCKQCAIWSEWRHPEQSWDKQNVHDKALADKLTAHWNARTTPETGASQ